jgi:hypothetical protein
MVLQGCDIVAEPYLLPLQRLLGAESPSFKEKIGLVLAGWNIDIPTPLVPSLKHWGIL